MQGAFARLCVVVAAAIFNPLLFPHENTTLPEQDAQLLTRMREHEERLARERAELDTEISRLEQEQETHSEPDYSWYFWSAVSLVIFVFIELCRGNLSDYEFCPIEEENESETVCPKTMVLSKDLLQHFCDRCTLSHENSQLKEFVEGLADNLLEAHGRVRDPDADMEILDFVGIGSMFESWQVCKPLTCDLIVPFSPPHPYHFQFGLTDVPPNMQGCGVIEVGDEGCLCGSADLGEDLICLVHLSGDKVNQKRSPDQLLCSKNTNLLSKHQVMKWFQISVTKSWSQICHKYDFDLTFRNLDTAGAFKIRLPSGKVVVLNLIPAVRFEDCDAYFVTHFPPNGASFPEDPYWQLSFAVYEKKLLKYYTKLLPQSSCHLHCLQIVAFLHRKQTGLTGGSALSVYHLKTALFHLLMNKQPCMWSIDQIDQRLGDVLDFMQRSLQEKRLIHALVGNVKVPKEVLVPAAFLKAEPVNLFRSLVLDRALYDGTRTHFQEMLRNAPALLREYTPTVTSGGLHFRLNEIL